MMATPCPPESWSIPMTATTTQAAPSLYALNIGDDASLPFTTVFERNDDDGSATIADWPVFRAGTFADSFGFVETWTVEHLAQMAAHYEILLPVFRDIPVRAGHQRDIERVKGYVTALRVHEGFLLADIELTEPEAVEKWDRGTYRNRSAEIGFYETNDGAAFWPVFLGVAFVDIPAVEGLFSKATDQDTPTRYFTEASPQMPTTNQNTDPVSTAGDLAPARRPSNSEPLTTTVTVTSGGQDFSAPGQPQPVTGTTTANPATPAIGTPTPGAPAPQMFEINGEQLDLATIGTRLAAATAFEEEQLEASRAAFVKGLVDGNKLAAPQREGMEAFAKSLSGEQFTAWQAMFEGAPELSVLGNHADGVTNADNTAGQPTTEEQNLATLEETVKMHERSGMPVDQLHKTASYQKLQALKAAGASS